MSTKIEWTDQTWNPVTGCTKVSAGCKNCYAERIAKRFWKDRKFGDIQCHEDRLNKPLKWRKPRMVFVNSMSDLFLEEIPGTFLDKIFSVMCEATQHIFQVLTKRPKRMSEYILPGFGRKYPHIWLGASMEDQPSADERMKWLLKTDAAVRFVSYEPALGALDLFRLELNWTES